MRLPDDETRALEIIDLFLAHGADPAARTQDGKTAADAALERGLDAAAERLRAGSHERLYFGVARGFQPRVLRGR